MARPPVEWPIPAYVMELRERIVLTYQVPGAALAPLIPAPVAPALVRGHAVVALCLGSGRNLKSVGGNPHLAGDFHLTEIFTPVYWQGACRPALRGNLLLHSSTDSHGLSRLIRTALGFPCGCEARSESPLLPRGGAEAPWPEASLFSSHEAAEAHLLHPEAYFVPEAGGLAVNAAPVHQYARCSTHLVPDAANPEAVAAVLGVAREEVRLDHVFLQKRCTHTWSFPPERILTARGIPRWASSTVGAGREPVGAQR